MARGAAARARAVRRRARARGALPRRRSSCRRCRETVARGEGSGACQLALRRPRGRRRPSPRSARVQRRRRPGGRLRPPPGARCSRALASRAAPGAGADAAAAEATAPLLRRALRPLCSSSRPGRSAPEPTRPRSRPRCSRVQPARRSSAARPRVDAEVRAALAPELGRSLLRVSAPRSTRAAAALPGRRLAALRPLVPPHAACRRHARAAGAAPPPRASSATSSRRAAG